MSGTASRYTLIVTPSARSQLREHLPEAVAFAAHEFIVGALLDNPQRVGKRLQAPLADRYSARRGTYRVIYRIDDQERTVTVVDVSHRRDAYRVNHLTLDHNAGFAWYIPHDGGLRAHPARP